MLLGSLQSRRDAGPLTKVRVCSEYHVDFLIKQSWFDLVCWHVRIISGNLGLCNMHETAADL